MKYFSDIEGVNDGNNTFRISITVWNGIATIVNALISNNLLAKDFPKQCPDGNGICGVDDQSFYVAAIAIIPRIKNILPQYGGDIQYLSTNNFDPFDESKDENEEKTKEFTYDVLDFIEFVYKHIYDTQNGNYHDFFKHFELKFLDTTFGRDKFVIDVNEILERNHTGFILRKEGNIERIVNEVLLNSLEIQDLEPTLGELIAESIDRFKSPKKKERSIAIEKLWDAFERLKTIENPDDKKSSSNLLLTKASQGQSHFFELLKKECEELTSIGNKYQIRHFEMNKNQIVSEEHIDYFFYRMYSLLSLLVKAL